MNTTRKAKVMTLVGLGAIALSSAAVFAGNNDTITDATNSQSGALHQRGNRQMGERMGMKMGSGFVNPFYRTDLTDAEKTAAEAIEEAHRTSLKTYFDTNSGSLREAHQAAKTESGTTTPVVDAALKAIHDKYIADITPYIATDKLEQFKQMCANGPMMAGRMGGKMGRGRDNQPGFERGGRGENFGGNMKAVAAIDAKLKTLADTNAKTAWLNGVKAKIDALATKATSKKSKNMLERISDVINERLEELSGTAVTDEVIDNLLK